MDKICFESLQEPHLPAVLEIYNHYVLNSTATFHLRPLSPEEMRALTASDDPRHAAYVMLNNGDLCGYCLISRHRTREAYDETAEITVYLRPDAIGKGLGGRAVRFLEEVAQRNGFHVLIATICVENERSIRLFERNGYEKCAHYKEVGRKFGRWLDVVAYQKIIG